jgi:hypothetical protein
MSMSTNIRVIVIGVGLTLIGGEIADRLNFGSWGWTAVGLVAVLLTTLADREGFYGVEPKTKDHSTPPTSSRN